MKPTVTTSNAGVVITQGDVKIAMDLRTAAELAHEILNQIRVILPPELPR